MRGILLFAIRAEASAGWSRRSQRVPNSKADFSSQVSMPTALSPGDPRPCRETEAQAEKVLQSALFCFVAEAEIGSIDPQPIEDTAHLTSERDFAALAPRRLAPAQALSLIAPAPCRRRCRTARAAVGQDDPGTPAVRHHEQWAGPVAWV